MDATSSYHTSAAPNLRKPTPITTTTASAPTSTSTMASSRRSKRVRQMVTGSVGKEALREGRVRSSGQHPELTRCGQVEEEAEAGRAPPLGIQRGTSRQYAS